MSINSKKYANGKYKILSIRNLPQTGRVNFGDAHNAKNPMKYPLIDLQLFRQE